MDAMNGQSLLKRQKVDFMPDESITHMAAGRNHVAIATKDKTVFIVSINDGKQTDCDLNQYLRNKSVQAKIHKLFLDPLARFLIISLAYAADNQPLENLLFVKRIQSLPRLKNYLISAIAWNFPRTTQDPSSTNSTGTILLGTTKGLILQAEFIHSDESKFFPLSGGPRQYVKEIFDVGSDYGALTGIEFHQIPSNNHNERNYIIFISTNSRLYRMVGSVPANVDPPPLNLIFAQNATNYKDVPGRFINSKLDFYYPSFNSPPTRYAWLTEPAVMTGEIQNQISLDKLAFESSSDMISLTYEQPDDLDLPLSASTPLGMSPSFGFSFKDRPVSIVATNFHVIIIFRTYIKAICILNSAIVYEEYLPNKYGEIHGMAKDPIKNTIWVFCDRTILKYKILNENRNIWRIYLDQKKFALAKKYSMDDEANYNRVLCEEAQHYFNMGQYETSAEIFAQSRKPFEDISLMFLEVPSIKALRKYLLIKIEQSDPSKSIQITMMLAWLLEILISDICIHNASDDESSTKELNELQVELQELFSKKQILDCFAKYPNLFYGIIRNYSDQDIFVRLAKLIGDFGHVVEHYMDLGEYVKALEIMKAIKRDDLFYSYGHILMKWMPRQLVDALIEQDTIEPSKLIPVLIQENPFVTKCTETIRYLEYCIKERNSDNRVIYNYLFELYARHRDEQTLIDFVTSQVDSNGSEYCLLDLQLCLRLCTELKLVRTCVSLYSAMSLLDEAVDLALTFDIELAKSIANKSETDEQQKRLWLTISQRVLTKNLDIRIATNLLKECKLLRIEDILPFFPDYTTIDFFKDAIRQSLQDYKNQILTLRDGTYEKIADDITNEIKTFRNRYSIIKAGSKCYICNRSLLTSAFYVFPCGHFFHRDCVLREMLKLDSTYQALEQELDNIISRECIYCGSMLANHVDKPPVLTTKLDEYLL